MKSARYGIASGGSAATLLIADPLDTLGRAPEVSIEFLERQLSRAAGRRTRAAGASRKLFELFGYDAEHELPAAAVSRFSEQDIAPDGHWLRADPVGLDVGSQLVLRQHGGFGLAAEEIQALAHTLHEYFAEQNLEFLAPGPDRWYLNAEQEFALRTSAPDEPGLGDLSDALPEGETEDRWRRVINETQILLHNHPVNVKRRAAGLPAPDSLWFWGAGTLPSPRPARFREVVGADPLAVGLQRLCGAEASAGPLMVARGECAALWRRWQDLGRGWSRHILLPQFGLEFRAGPLDALRVWRHRRDLSRLLSGAGERP